MYRGYRRYGPGLGYGRGGGGWYGAGFGRGRRFASPNCDWYPDLPRGWWAMPQYQSNLEQMGFAPPPVSARWDPYGTPTSPEAIEYEISLLENQIKGIQKEIEHLKSLNKPAK